MIFRSVILPTLAVLCAVKVSANPGMSGTCFITGVPTGSMVNRVVAYNTTSRFSVAMSPSPYVPGQSHTITLARLMGSTGPFRGLLLYVEDSVGQRIGTLALGNGNGPVQGLTCTANVNPTSTLTHTSTSSFLADQTFTWMAPATVNGPIMVKLIAYETAPTNTWNVPAPLVVTGPTPMPQTTSAAVTTAAGSTMPGTTMPGSTTAGMAVDCVCSMTPTTLGAGVSAAIVKNTTHAGILIRGPSTPWLGLGFGTVMANSAALIGTSSSFSRYQMAASAAQGRLAMVGSPQTPSGFSFQGTVSGGSQSLCLIFPSLSANGIVLTGTSANVIYAQGAGATLSAAGHGANRGSGSLAIRTTCTPSPTVGGAANVGFGFGFVLAICASILSMF